MTSFRKYLLLILLPFCLIGLFAPFSVKAQEKAWHYESIQVDIDINKDSTFTVEETQTYRLKGSFGYFYRDISLKDIDHISEVKVFNGKGKKIPEEQYKVNTQSGSCKIKWNFERRNFDNELKSWKIKYKVYGALGFYEDYDEIYWNAIFSDREARVNKTKVNVDLPGNFEKNEIGKRMFVGEEGSENEINNYKVYKNKVEFWANDISPGEYLTIVASWPKGVVEKPAFYRNQITTFAVLGLAILLPIVIFVRMFILWMREGKDPELDKTIIAQYEPPEDLPPALVGVLVNQKFTIKEVTATLIDLAVRGYIRIKEKEEKFLGFGKKDYTFKKLKIDEEGLKPFEKEIFKGIFDAKQSGLSTIFGSNDEKKESGKEESKEEVAASELKNSFPKHLKDIKKEVHKEFAQTGYAKSNIMKERKKYRAPFAILVFLGIAIFFLVSFLTAWVDLLGVIALGVSVIISGIIVMVFSNLMPSLTQKGAEQKWKWLGFKTYLHTAERFRLGAETVDNFSKYLAYAVVFEVEKEWAERFADLEYQDPDWYVSHGAAAGAAGAASGPSSFSEFASNISSFNSSISNTLSSGGSSGMGGGGAAGGGAGGGGGGAG